MPVQPFHSAKGRYERSILDAPRSRTVHRRRGWYLARVSIDRVNCPVGNDVDGVSNRPFCGVEMKIQIDRSTVEQAIAAISYAWGCIENITDHEEAQITPALDALKATLTAAPAEPQSWEALYWGQVKLTQDAKQKAHKVNDLLLRRQAAPADPVAWGMERKGRIYDVICSEEHDRCEGEYTIPLYRAPQPQREPLTNDEIWDIWDDHYTDVVSYDRPTFAIELYRKIINASHGIGVAE